MVSYEYNDDKYAVKYFNLGRIDFDELDFEEQTSDMTLGYSLPDERLFPPVLRRHLGIFLRQHLRLSEPWVSSCW